LEGRNELLNGSADTVSGFADACPKKLCKIALKSELELSGSVVPPEINVLLFSIWSFSNWLMTLGSMFICILASKDGYFLE
jgi:hypothetical protein